MGQGDRAPLVEKPMSGFITTRHLFTQAPEIIKGFGWRVWARGMMYILMRRKFTFLGLVSGQV